MYIYQLSYLQVKRKRGIILKLLPADFLLVASLFHHVMHQADTTYKTEEKTAMKTYIL